MAEAFEVLWVPVDSLIHNPANYRSHPEEQLKHLQHSLTEFGWYRPIVVATDNVILAGHGVIEAAREAGHTEVPVYYVDFDSADPRAAKLMVVDNEVWHLAENDDRVLTNLLKELSQSETGLDGTGYDEMMLANLVMVTRAEEEIADFDAAAEWVGMPDMGEAERQTRVQLIVWCDTIEERNQALAILGAEKVSKKRNTISIQWPNKEREPREDSSLRFVKDT